MKIQMLHVFFYKSSQTYDTETENDSYLGTERERGYVSSND
jgi:hypothetical protein